MKKDSGAGQIRGTLPDKTHIEKYHANPFTNSKEDYYNEKTLRILCSILLSKNIKRVDCVLLDLLFHFFVKMVKTIGMNCRRFSSLRGSVVVNYIDIKHCTKLALSNLYEEIYTLSNLNDLFEGSSFEAEEQDDTARSKNYNYINVLQDSYLYYKQLCMKQREKYDSMENFDGTNPLDSLHNMANLNYLNIGNNSSSNENVNVLFLNENIDIEKYKEIMALRKKYVHDHMPIIPLSLNRKEKKTGLYNEKADYYEEFSSSHSSSSKSSLSSSSESSPPSSDDLEFFHHMNENVREGQKLESDTKEDMGQEKMNELGLREHLKNHSFFNKDGLLLRSHGWLAKDTTGVIILLHGIQCHARLNFLRQHVEVVIDDDVIVNDENNGYVYEGSCTQYFSKPGYYFCGLYLGGYCVWCGSEKLRNNVKEFDDFTYDVMQYIENLQDSLNVCNVYDEEGSEFSIAG
ncbi:hypothetical protein C922_01291 [Plasmodium inui San Antonio 1]|uniref:Uncharacterized protein n=1 Tax=Plasmodium inui San Antonio 1 TaxID=1237626 RepID=W7AS08_9APIC|nr:hypothetical protein C922_01291 [Plasmodium inui San Antonio 1]EUD68271.1 hypothetical protein C922_01291 [Plasmodium inui San Antonio 1]